MSMQPQSTLIRSFLLISLFLNRIQMFKKTLHIGRLVPMLLYMPSPTSVPDGHGRLIVNQKQSSFRFRPNARQRTGPVVMDRYGIIFKLSSQILPKFVIRVNLSKTCNFSLFNKLRIGWNFHSYLRGILGRRILLFHRSYPKRFLFVQ